MISKFHVLLVIRMNIFANGLYFASLIPQIRDRSFTATQDKDRRIATPWKDNTLKHPTVNLSSQLPHNAPAAASICSLQFSSLSP